MTNFNFKFLGAWLVIVASITGLQAQNDFTLKGKDEMVPAGVWNDVNGEYINAHGGGILLFDSKYYAPDYSPVIGQFYNQNPDDKIEIGAFPIVNVYANLHLKRTRFFIMMYHVNAGSGKSNYFLAPHYPINPRMIKFGLSWNFFD